MMHPNETEDPGKRPWWSQRWLRGTRYGARERMNTGERTVCEIIHALKKHSICMVALMLHRHESRYKTLEYMKITASSQVQPHTINTSEHQMNVE